MSKIFKFIKIPEFATIPQIVSKILKYLNRILYVIIVVPESIETKGTYSLTILRKLKSNVFSFCFDVLSIQPKIQRNVVNILTNIINSVSISSKYFLSNKKSIMNFLLSIYRHSSCLAMILKSNTFKTQILLDELEFDFRKQLIS